MQTHQGALPICEDAARLRDSGECSVDKIKAQCPRGKESLLASPSPDDIEKLVCKLASSELVEKEAAEEVCKLIKEQFPAVKMQPE